MLRLPAALGATKILTPDAERLALVLDKARTFEIARGVGIEVPADWQPEQGEDHPALADRLIYPVAIKWADPNAVQAALARCDIALEKVEYAADAAQLAAILARYDGLGRWPLVQTYCPGYGLGQTAADVRRTVVADLDPTEREVEGLRELDDDRGRRLSEARAGLR